MLTAIQIIHNLWSTIGLENTSERMQDSSRKRVSHLKFVTIPENLTRVIDSKKPVILVVAVAGALGIVQDMKELFFQSLANKVHFWFSTTDLEAIRKLRSIHRPRSVWIVDTIPPHEHSMLLQLIAFYVREKGLNAVFGAGFPTFTRMGDIERIFGEFGKSWRNGDYYRDQAYLNKVAIFGNSNEPGQGNNSPLDELLKRTTSQFEASYSMKALRLRGISSTDIIYLSGKFHGQKDLDSIDNLEAAVVFSRVKKGWLGYIGDVNTEKPSDTVLKAMLNIDL
jgi:hypothetical protein